MNFLLKEIENRAKGVWENDDLQSRLNWLNSCNVDASEYYTNWDDLHPEVRHILAMHYDEETRYKYTDWDAHNPETYSDDADVHLDY